ncbi:MAG: amidase [Paracoccaceae bacterium]
MAAKRLARGEVPLTALSGVELRDRLASGALQAEDVAKAFLAEIQAREPEVRAWAFLDSDDVLGQARRLDALRRSGRPVGPLHGLPVGLKDIIDVAQTPTENGTPLDKGRVPTADAVVAARLRSAGAILMGKTVSTELAYLHPGPTRNPAAPNHTPGGSSSGSAAAVAARMTPLAVGTQTGGSVIRPAAYCGCVGFKPTFGAIPRTGILPQSPNLDTVGVFAGSVEDAAMLAEVLFGHDAGDPATHPAPPPRLLDVCLSQPPMKPTLAFLRPPGFEDGAPVMREAMAELVSALGGQCFEVTLPPAFDSAADIRERINFAEMAKCYFNYEKRGWDGLSEVIRQAMSAGKAVAARDYISALDWADVLNAGLDEIFSRCDAIMTPATPGPAPEGLESTGSAIFNGLWTLCRTPAITVPLLETQTGLPLGVQLVGRRGDDARLLRTARWLAHDFPSIMAGEKS